MLGRPSIVVREWHIDALVAEGERNTDKARRHRIIAGADGVEARQRCGFQSQQYVLQLVLGQHGPVLALLDRRRR